MTQNKEQLKAAVALHEAFDVFLEAYGIDLSPSSEDPIHDIAWDVNDRLNGLLNRTIAREVITEQCEG